MAKKTNPDLSISDLFNDLREQIALSSNADSEPYIPDILEFCYSKRYLNLQFKLYPMQQIILKTLYRGQRGNEHIRLTEDELQLLVDNKLDGPGGVYEKYKSEYLFRDLVLVLGRRSGKDFMTSLIALYECMKLLELPGGSPFTYYGVAPGNPIYILTVATSSDQARILFTEIKDKMQTSEYFKNKIGKVEADRIWLLTPEDRKKNKELAEAGLDSARTHGSVVIMCGHSNSEGLLGKRIFCLLLDEVASFKTTGGSTSGDRMYSALTPATADFKVPNKGYIDADDGKWKPYYDSKIISISSPRGEEGILFKLFSGAPEAKTRLAFRLPTWKVNANFDEDSLRAEFKFMSPSEFAMEFGAEFSGTAGQKFIPDRYVDEALDLGTQLGLDQRLVGIPGIVYYAHLDPASTSHNYALVVLHTEEHIRIIENKGIRKKEKVKIFVIDHIKVWHPTPDASIKVSEVDDYIIDLAKRFRFGMVTYDSWNSDASIQKLRSLGIPSRETPYRKQYKMRIYDHLEHLLVNHQIALPRRGQYASQMELELKCLKRSYSNMGFKIEPDPEGQVTTDDVADALAGACGMAIEETYAGYPKGGTVYLPQSPNSQQPMWSIGRGSYNPGQWNILNRKFGF